MGDTDDINKAEKNIKEKARQGAIDDIRNTLNLYKLEINKLSSDETSIAMIPNLASQLAMLKFEAMEIPDNKSLVSEIESSISLLNKKDTEITQKINEDNRKESREIISNSLNLYADEVKGLSPDESSIAMIPNLASQLSLLKLEAMDLPESNSLVSEIENCINLLNIKDAEITKKFKEDSERKEEQDYLSQLNSLVDKYQTEIKKMPENGNSSPMLAEISSKLSSIKVEAMGLTKVDTTSIITEIDNCTSLLNQKEQNINVNIEKQFLVTQEKAEKELIKKQQQELFNSINKQIDLCNEEADKLPLDLASNNMIMQIKAQLFTLKTSTEELTQIETTPLIEKINKCTSLLDAKMANIEKTYKQQEEKMIAENKALIKKYNNNVISLLQRENSSLNVIKDGKKYKGMKGSAKKDQIIRDKKYILKTLERVETGYLYPSVLIMYNQVYSKAWQSNDGGESLEVDDQFEVLNYSVTTKKWDLNDNF